MPNPTLWTLFSLCWCKSGVWVLKSVLLYWWDSLCWFLCRQRALRCFSWRGFMTTSGLMSEKAEVNRCDFWESDPQPGRSSGCAPSLGRSCRQWPGHRRCCLHCGCHSGGRTHTRTSRIQCFVVYVINVVVSLFVWVDTLACFHVRLCLVYAFALSMCIFAWRMISGSYKRWIRRLPFSFLITGFGTGTASKS